MTTSIQPGVLSVPSMVEAALRRVRNEQQRAARLITGAAKYRRLSTLHEQEARLWTLLVRHTAEPVHRRAAIDAQCAARAGPASTRSSPSTGRSSRPTPRRPPPVQRRRHDHYRPLDVTAARSLRGLRSAADQPTRPPDRPLPCALPPTRPAAGLRPRSPIRRRDAPMNLTTTTDTAPGATDPGPDYWAAARTAAVRAGSAVIRGTITAWRYLCTVVALARLGLLWRTFCGVTGLAVQRTHTDPYGTRLHTTIHAVPRLDRYRVNAHGWTMRVRLRPGQHLDQYTEAAIPLRHTARVQSVKALELPDQPGFLELRVLRRDPLVRVTQHPHQLEPGRLAVGATETGDPMVLDFTDHPHYQLIGATGSGKSMLLSCVQAAIAPTDGVLVFWDLKFGIEAEAWRARYTEVATTQREVLTSCQQVLWLAEQRAAILRRSGCATSPRPTPRACTCGGCMCSSTRSPNSLTTTRPRRSPTSCCVSCCGSCSWSARWAST